MCCVWYHRLICNVNPLFKRFCLLLGQILKGGGVEYPIRLSYRKVSKGMRFIVDIVWLLWNLADKPACDIPKWYGNLSYQSCSKPVIWTSDVEENFAKIYIPNWQFHLSIRCDMAFIEPRHRNKPSNTYLPWSRGNGICRALLTHWRYHKLALSHCWYDDINGSALRLWYLHCVNNTTALHWAVRHSCGWCCLWVLRPCLAFLIN